MGIDFVEIDIYIGILYNYFLYLFGNVYKGKELLVMNVVFCYNVIVDEMEVKEFLEILDKEVKVLIKFFDIYVKIGGNDIFVFVFYDGGIEKGGYFQVFFEGNKYDFFKKVKKDFIVVKKVIIFIICDIFVKFVDKFVYYIVIKDGKFYELFFLRKKKLKVFLDNEKLVKNYVNFNNLDLNNEKDLIRVIKYYDGV